MNAVSLRRGESQEVSCEKYYIIITWFKVLLADF